ncbi:MAG: hypothetical protein HN337_02040 [Deltaproteobacteria bacterium]|jgi:tetratricopeptide (TPR) repeat protein|nr:hypothetical protein [Deltaproteobacteria bacterium]
MRRDKNKYGIVRGILTVLVVTFLISTLSGCAEKTAKPAHKKLPQRARQGDVIRPASVPPPSQMVTPEGKASMRLVEKGKAYIDSAEFDLARTTFRNAISVDTGNGVAYYYLALTYYYINQPDLAYGLLDKANQLLGYDEGWNARIEELRSELSGGSPASHSDDEPEGYGSF